MKTVSRGDARHEAFDKRMAETVDGDAPAHASLGQPRAINRHSMSDQQMAELHERLVAGRSNQATSERVFLRGWNACLDWVHKQIKLSCDEPVEDQPVEELAE